MTAQPTRGRSKKIAIIQSNYIPWKGYFDIINMVDEFVLFDEVQYTKRDWRNRNKIKTPAGSQWLTIPVVSKSKFDQSIDTVEIAEPWADKHWRSIELNYKRAAHFGTMAPRVRSLFESCQPQRLLSDVNRILLRGLSDLAGISTPLTSSRDYDGDGHKTDRLLAICLAAGATCYLSGPAAQSYLDVDRFRAAGVEVEYMNYEGYSPYTQLHGDFDHFVSMVDLLLNTGPEASRYMKSFPHE